MSIVSYPTRLRGESAAIGGHVVWLPQDRGRALPWRSSSVRSEWLSALIGSIKGKVDPRRGQSPSSPLAAPVSIRPAVPGVPGLSDRLPSLTLARAAAALATVPPRPPSRAEMFRQSACRGRGWLRSCPQWVSSARRDADGIRAADARKATSTDAPTSTPEPMQSLSEMQRLPIVRYTTALLCAPRRAAHSADAAWHHASSKARTWRNNA